MTFKKAVVFLLTISYSIANSQPKQYLITHGVGNLWEEKDNFKGIMSKMSEFGCNSTVISIQWERVYSKYNTKPDWSIIDDQVNHAIKLNWKIGFRIYIGRSYTSTEREKFWSDEETALDFNGKPMTIYYNRSHASFFSDAAYRKPIDFIKEVVSRYKYLQNLQRLIYFSVVTTNEEEYGYAHQNEQFPNVSRYDAIYDHSKFAMIKWKDWIQKKYKTIRTVNAAWGMNYRSFHEVEPNVNLWNTKSSFTGIRGKEWYLFRHLYLKKYYDEITGAIKSIDPNILVAIEAGSFCDNISALRGTLGFVDLSKSVDYIKYNDSHQSWSIDFIRSNTSKILFSEVSVGENSKKSDELIKYVDYNFERGCTMMYFAVQTSDDVNRAETAIRYSANKWKNQIPKEITPSKTMSYTLSEIIDNYQAVVQRWQNISENGKYIVDVKFFEDILILEKPIENPLPELIENNNSSEPPPIIDPSKPNQSPVQAKSFETQVIFDQTFYFYLPFDVVKDFDGFIALTELIEAPSWVKYSRYEQLVTGKAPNYGKFPFKIRFYDNSGASVVAEFTIEVTPPRVDVEVISATYFDESIKGLGMLDEGREIILGENPQMINMIVRTNLDSVRMEFDLKGAYKTNRISKYGKNVIHSLFLEGRGFIPPVGNYQLAIKAIKNDSIVVISNLINFSVKAFADNNLNKINDWVVYPNPFDEIINLKIASNQDIKNLKLEIYNTSAQKTTINLDDYVISDNTLYLDTDKIQLKSGIYILKVINEKQEVLMVKKIFRL